MASSAVVVSTATAASPQELEGRDDILAALGFALQDPPLAERLVASERLGLDELEAFARLADQVGRLGIDYKKLGVGWHHPSARIEYRRGNHSSFSASRERQEESLACLRSLAIRYADADAGDHCLDCKSDLVHAFLHGVGVDSDASAAWAPDFELGILPALRQELVMPLRALNEGGKCSTFRGDPLPRKAMADCVLEVTRAVVEGRYRSWRYSGNSVCVRQLEGLTEAQRSVWMSKAPTRAPIEDSSTSLHVHEGRPEASELDYFWATKIGGPSHGFDYETQCLLPLLCNARHKVVLVEDPAWPHHPAGRAHFRLLWTACGWPRLWLEAVNADFVAMREEGPMQSSFWTSAVLTHAMLKADAMGVALSITTDLAGMAEALMPADGCLNFCCNEELVLRPSNGVVEASDYLSDRHDWLQLEEEVVPSGPRCLYIPGSCREPVSSSSSIKCTSSIGGGYRANGAGSSPNSPKVASSVQSRRSASSTSSRAGAKDGGVSDTGQSVSSTSSRVGVKDGGASDAAASQTSAAGADRQPTSLASALDILDEQLKRLRESDIKLGPLLRRPPPGPAPPQPASSGAAHHVAPKGEISDAGDAAAEAVEKVTLASSTRSSGREEPETDTALFTNKLAWSDVANEARPPPLVATPVSPTAASSCADSPVEMVSSPELATPESAVPVVEVATPASKPTVHPQPGALASDAALLDKMCQNIWPEVGGYTSKETPPLMGVIA